MTYKFDVGDQVAIKPFKDIVTSELNTCTSMRSYSEGIYFGIYADNINKKSSGEYTIHSLTTYRLLPAYSLIDNATHKVIPCVWGEDMLLWLCDDDNEGISAVSEDDIDNFLSL